MSLIEQLPSPPSGKTGWPWTQETNPDIYAYEIHWPTISIVTPSYNQGHFLEETIRSVLLQNYPKLEYTIIDGGSTDHSVEIIKKYEPWINFWVSEPDSGQANAINKGLDKCNGAVFNWLNSDDWYEKGALQKVGAFFYQHNQLLALCGREYHVGPNREDGYSTGTPVENSAAETIVRLHFDQPPTFFRTAALKSIGPIREDMHYFFDTEMWVRFLLYHGQQQIIRVNHFLNFFRFHGDSKTESVPERFQEEKEALQLALTDWAGLQPVQSISIKQQSLAQRIRQSWEENKIKVIPRELKKAFIKNQFIQQFGQHQFSECRQLLPQIWSYQLSDPVFVIKKLALLLPNSVLTAVRVNKEK